MNIIELPNTPTFRKRDSVLFIIHLIGIISLFYGSKVSPSFNTNYGFIFRVLGFAYPFLLVGMYTHKLKNNSIFLLWGILASLILILSIYCPEYDSYGDNILSPTRSLFFTLIAIRICHSISFIMFGFPFIATNQVNSIGDLNHYENRKLNISDFIFTIISVLSGVFSFIKL